MKNQRIKINRQWKLLDEHHMYCAHLFYCLAQLMHMVIYLLDLLTIYISSIYCVMVVCLHMKLQSPSSVAIVR